MNPLKQLSEQCGQSPWLDYVRRDLIEKGELATLIERDGVRGVTSNPSIFEKAIAGSEQYGEALKAFQKTGDHSISAIYEHLAIADIRAAADVLRPVWEATKHADGFISLECSPYLANATAATIEEARRLWETVDRPNLMVKVPGTEAGVPAIRALIGKGLNINVTLLFAVGMYEQVAEAYIAGLEDFAKSGGDVSKVASVASFFVSRIDSKIAKRLDKLGDEAAAGKLRNKVAIANAKVAYRSYQRLFAGARWEALAAKGAKTQRLLWASTSTKDPKLPDTLYVEELIGKDTVNTMPPATMDAFREHGKIHRDAVEHGLAEAEATMRALADAGISMKEVTDELVAEGVQQFADAFDQLLGAVAARRRTIFSGDKPDITIKAGDAAIEKAIAAETEKWRHDGLIRRLWEGDKTLWTGTDEDQWLGWLTIVGEELKGIGELERFQQEVKSGGSSDVVLLGMGGSSLGPEVLAETFGRQAGFPKFHMLDSTDPAQIKALEGAIDLGRSLFIVSSKSGSTLEPNIYMAYFFQQVANKVGKDKAAKHFVAVTDPGSSLDKHAQATGFAHVFYGVKSIGGRYSVLSKFGLVPAAAIGLDLRKLLATTQQMVRACGDDVPPAENPGVKLGIAMGVAARDFGRDKVTIIASPGIHDLGAWLEQLLAESTGKQGHGLIPVDSEPLASPDKYGRDRFFAYLALDGKEDPEAARGGRGAGESGPSGRAHGAPGCLACRPGILPLGDRDRGRRRGDRHRRVQPARCGGEQNRDARAHRAIREGRQAARRAAGVPRQWRRHLRRREERQSARAAEHAVRLSQVASRPRACGGLRGAARLHAPRPPAYRGAAGHADGNSGRDEGRHLRGLRAAFPAFDRPGLQGRAEFRRVRADHLRRSGRYSGARREIHVRHRQGGAGARRPAGAGGAGSAGAARPSEGCLHRAQGARARRHRGARLMPDDQSAAPNPPAAQQVSAPPRIAHRDADPCTMVIFGAGGDLTKRLVMPALYNLSRTGILPKNFALVGVDLAQGSAESWRDHLFGSLKEFVGNPSAEFHVDHIEQDAWDRLASRMYYLQGDLTKTQLYDDIRNLLHRTEREHDTRGNAIFYLAVADRFFATVVEHLGQSGLTDEQERDGEPAFWRRVVIEKPFGHSLEIGEAAQCAGAQGPAGGPGIPHRPFPRQGNGAEHHGLPLRQRAVRADLESRPHRPRADHGGRDDRRRAARQVLREDRRAARHGAEPSVPAPRDDRDGAAGLLRCRRHPQQEGGSVRRHAGGAAGARGARAIRRRPRAREGRPGLSRGA